MTTIRTQMLAAIIATSDDPATVQCFYWPVELASAWGRAAKATPVTCLATDLPEREFDDGYGGREGEPVIGFSERYVYVCGMYDGSEWIEAVPRTLAVAAETKLIPIIGG